MRKFAIKNELETRYEFNNFKSGFLHDPKGLGFTMEAGYTRIGSSWKRNYIYDTQRTITGDLIFICPDPYKAEQDLISFLRTSKNLTLEYATTAGTWLIDVDLISYDKSEITAGNVLKIPLQFITKSLWYQTDSYIISLLPLSEGEKLYDYTYSYTYNDHADGYVEAFNDGTIEAAIEVEFKGAIANPTLIVEQNGEEINRVEINATVPNNKSILYSSKDNDLYVKNSDGENLFSSLSLGNKNFFKLPLGTSKIHVTADSQLIQPIIITIYKYYRQV